MILSKTRRWGSSLGVIIPNKAVKELSLRENEEVIIEIIKKENPLKELFGMGSKDRITKEEFLNIRKILEERL